MKHAMKWWTVVFIVLLTLVFSPFFVVGYICKLAIDMAKVGGRYADTEAVKISDRLRS